MKKESPQTIEISLKTPLMILGILVVTWLLIQIRSILVLLFVSFIFTAALTPFVERLYQKKVPRAAAILLVYLAVLGFFFLAGLSIVPVVVKQTQELVLKLPDLISSLGETLGFGPISLREEENIRLLSERLAEFISGQFSGVSGNLIKVTVGFVNGLVFFFSVAVFTFYLLLEHEALKEYVLTFTPKDSRDRVESIINKVEKQLGAWLRGQLVLCLAVGFLSWAGLSLLKVQYALPLALIAGLLEVVPMLGPIIAAVPAIVITLVNSFWLAVLVAAFYFIVQQLENNILVPKIMEKALGLNPLITLFALLIGGKLFGILGALLAVPIVAVFQIILRDMLTYEE